MSDIDKKMQQTQMDRASQEHVESAQTNPPNMLIGTRLPEKWPNVFVSL